MPASSKLTDGSNQFAPGDVPENLSDEDILAAMRRISGYLDITPGDLKQVYALAYAHARERILGTPARDIMTSPVHSVREDESLIQVAKLLAQAQVAGVPVLDRHGQNVLGVISEKDFMRRMTAGEQSFMGLVADCMGSKGCPALKIKEQVAGDIMSAPAVTVSLDTPLGAMFELMQSKAINRLPVLEENHLTGIVSRDDLLAALTRIPGQEDTWRRKI